MNPEDAKAPNLGNVRCHPEAEKACHPAEATAESRDPVNTRVHYVNRSARDSWIRDDALSRGSGMTRST